MIRVQKTVYPDRTFTFNQQSAMIALLVGKNISQVLKYTTHSLTKEEKKDFMEAITLNHIVVN